MRSSGNSDAGRKDLPPRPADATTVLKIAATDAGVPPSALEAVHHALAAARRHTSTSVEDRRESFLRECWPHMGPTQQQHVSIHCRTVAAMTARLGRIQGLAKNDVSRLRLAGLLHDIGKCVISEQLLAKPARLTESERVVMSDHSAAGALIAVAFGADDRTVTLILHHHTHYKHEVRSDLPTGPTGREAHLLCVADALVSMMTDRPYCSARSVPQALAELQRCSGKQFDPAAVELAHRLYRQRHIAA